MGVPAPLRFHEDGAARRGRPNAGPLAVHATISHLFPDNIELTPHPHKTAKNRFLLVSTVNNHSSRPL